MKKNLFFYICTAVLSFVSCIFLFTELANAEAVGYNNVDCCVGKLGTSSVCILKTSDVCTPIMVYSSSQISMSTNTCNVCQMGNEEKLDIVLYSDDKVPYGETKEFIFIGGLFKDSLTMGCASDACGTVGVEILPQKKNLLGQIYTIKIDTKKYVDEKKATIPSGSNYVDVMFKLSINTTKNPATVVSKVFNIKIVEATKVIPVAPAGSACSSHTSSTPCTKDKNCVWVKKVSKCFSSDDQKVCPLLSDKKICDSIKVCTYEDNAKTCNVDKTAVATGTASSGATTQPPTDYTAAIDAHLKNKYEKPDGYNGPIPDCAWSGSCRNIGSLVEVAIKIGEMIFGLVAGIAFVFFVYGGFTMMLSFGNAEKVKKGQQILVAAVVGIIIVFSAYIMVDFLLDALNVSSGFRGVNL